MSDRSNKTICLKKNFYFLFPLTFYIEKKLLHSVSIELANKFEWTVCLLTKGFFMFKQVL